MMRDFFLISFLLNLLLTLNYQQVDGLIEIGTNPKNGKTFYVERTRGSWEEARTFCESQSPPMSLATIDSVPGDGDWDFLESKASQEIHGWYWTAARDTRSYRHYSWYPRNETIVGEIGPGPEWMVSRTCLTINAFNSNQQGEEEGFWHILVMPCEATNGFPMCQHF